MRTADRQPTADPCHPAGLRATRRLVLDRRGILVSRALTALQVPWERIPGARIDNDQIALAVEPDEVLTFGPFAGPNGAGPAERAGQIAAAMCWFREQALAAGRTGADRHVTPNPVALVGLVCYGLLLGAALWWHSRYG